MYREPSFLLPHPRLVANQLPHGSEPKHDFAGKRHSRQPSQPLRGGRCGSPSNFVIRRRFGRASGGAGRQTRRTNRARRQKKKGWTGVSRSHDCHLLQLITSHPVYVLRVLTRRPPPPPRGAARQLGHPGLGTCDARLGFGVRVGNFLGHVQQQVVSQAGAPLVLWCCLHARGDPLLLARRPTCQYREYINSSAGLFFATAEDRWAAPWTSQDCSQTRLGRAKSIVVFLAVQRPFSTATQRAQLVPSRRAQCRASWPFFFPAKARSGARLLAHAGGRSVVYFFPLTEARGAFLRPRTVSSRPKPPALPCNLRYGIATI